MRENKLLQLKAGKRTGLDTEKIAPPALTNVEPQDYCEFSLFQGQE